MHDRAGDVHVAHVVYWHRQRILVKADKIGRLAWR
jgi:hypothetical protein